MLPETKARTSSCPFPWTLSEEVPATPRTLCRPSFEHGPELGQVGVSGNQIVHPARWAKVDIHAQLRATCRRKRELQVRELERIRQDNSAAKVISLGPEVAQAGGHAAPNGPERRDPRESANTGQGLDRASAIDSFVPNGGEKASSDRAGALPFLSGFQQLPANRNLLSEPLGVSGRRLSGEPNISGVAAKIPEVIPGVLRGMLLSVLIDGFEGVE